MVTQADKSMIPHLITLWQKSFGDSETYISMFLEQNFERIKTIVYVTEEVPDIPVSVAYLLPVTYIQDGQKACECWYLYAAATLPEWRGRGFFVEILKYVETLAEPMVLVPGEESLIGYYEKQGMHKWLSERKSVVDVISEKSVAVVEVSDLSVEEYIALREVLLEHDEMWKKTGYLNWSPQFLKYICSENQFCGGEIKRITIGNKQFAAMYRIEDEVVKVLELLPQTHVKECLNGLVEFINEAKQVHVDESGYKIAEVMFQPNVLATSKLKVPAEEGYFNLIMA